MQIEMAAMKRRVAKMALVPPQPPPQPPNYRMEGSSLPPSLAADPHEAILAAVPATVLQHCGKMRGFRAAFSTNGVAAGVVPARAMPAKTAACLGIQRLKLGPPEPSHRSGEMEGAEEVVETPRGTPCTPRGTPYTPRALNSKLCSANAENR